MLNIFKLKQPFLSFFPLDAPIEHRPEKNRPHFSILSPLISVNASVMLPSRDSYIDVSCLIEQNYTLGCGNDHLNPF